MIVIILSTYERPNRRRVGNSMRSRRPFYRLGGLALVLGALMFSLTKARGYVDPDDSLLGYFMFTAFTLWLVGLATLYSRYGPVSGQLGKSGLGIAVVGVLLLAVGHRFTFMGEVDLFMIVILGGFALMLGPFLFGIAVLQREVLPRYGRAMPLFTGLMGFAWFFFTNSESNQFSFMFFRSLFALGWILLGYVLWSDAREIIEDPSTAGLEEAKI
jgi:hypothetical protein